jgi:site-specific DNA-methyltransferase (adenine-specific)
VLPYYVDDACTIYHGEAFELLHDLAGVGALVTDPPYSSGGQFRGDRMGRTVAKYVGTDVAAYRHEFAGDNRDQRAFAVWSTMWLTAARHASTVGAPCIVFTDWRQLPTMTDAVQAGGWIWRNIGTWWKPGVRMQRGRFSASAEYVVYGTNGPATEGGASPQNVISCPPVDGDDKTHVAQKPAGVLRWALQVVPPGAVILDPFMGSGSTLRAAKDLGLRAVGIDVDERCCEVAARGLAQEVLPLEYGPASAPASALL